MRFQIFGGADCTDMFLAQFVPVVTISEDVNELQDLTNSIIQLLIATSSSSSSSQNSQEEALKNLVQSFSSVSTTSKRESGNDTTTNNNTSSNSNNNSTTIDLGLACCALHAIITNIATFDVDVQQSAKELVILGLSQSAATVLSDLAVSNKKDILATMAGNVRMAPNISRVHVMKNENNNNNDDDDDAPPGDEPAISYTVTLDRRSGGCNNSSETTNSNNNHLLSFTADSSTLKSLLADLIVARESM